ncbi:glycosyltransferase, MGT family [Amycolatopsis xylanica]|uniref:Glycosyltransferase, MGT family n=1 Tax=Amycolatopsis xylanica TaxID=589385 RepID=A0A1H3M0S0_9PSEU|nr:glycosyltransferase [Amycolatopsis xylanica]SDY70300.1 glycosyltransferase, MGT family [Amycolatopsis xylanica]
MKLLFTSLGSHGHTYPLLPLAVAARKAGHEVIFATGEALLPGLRKAGLDTAPVTIDISSGFAAVVGDGPMPPPEDELPGIVAKVFGDALPRLAVEKLKPVLEAEQPDLVVYESGNPGGGFAAKLAGIPAVAHGFGRVSVGDLTDSISKPLVAYAAELGIELASPLMIGDPYIDICPESVQAPDFMAGNERIPLRPVGWNEPGELPGIVDEDEPLVYLTLGTAFGNVDVLKGAIEGLAKLPVNVLVAAGPSVDVDALGGVPPNVHLAAWVPQADLLPHVALVVHHGGSGTTLGTFGAGRPQLVIPQGADQFTNAEAVLAAGVGTRLLPDEFTAEAVYTQAKALLADETIHAAAKRLAEEVASMPSPEDVAAQLPAYAR